MLTKEKAKEIADDYLLKNCNEYCVFEVYEKYYGGQQYDASFGAKDAYFVSCIRKQIQGLESSLEKIVSFLIKR